ncbi:hypothetical protein EBI_25369 [Enterocytozoon bieneusi H348]|nr:hypothetical protein EBI_25369 [Enterocytozoon bieneusi H348]|eukprot:XP_002652131.1 hypothetical protein EBI_25369 [Enterocytozoon bieneusi H348]
MTIEFSQPAPPVVEPPRLCRHTATACCQAPAPRGG